MPFRKPPVHRDEDGVSRDAAILPDARPCRCFVVAGCEYRALVDGEPFVARLDTEVFGRVVRYEGLWEMELADGR